MPSSSALAAVVAADVGGRMDPASGKLLETLGWERDCATGTVGDLFQADSPMCLWEHADAGS